MTENSGSGRKVLLIVGIASGIMVLIMLSIGGLGLWGWNMFTSQAKDAFNRLAVVEEHLGEVTDISIDLAATGEVPGDEVFVFELTGTKGSGVATAEVVTVDEDTEEVVSGVLRLPSGEEYDLFPGESSGVGDEQ